ncbi:putative galactinol--sucrose galactosyltransferase [Rosa chinensis]|uniref:galactinol--sucrose galactosyltransferase n=1 Tax=Rosa chinensis TaxID=74649 RepID=A0A2P6Q1V6_ROSCH|nr:probable galactinol--sucrose galactosyltransferase 2 [Rosa chinensis]PRQ28178.1 putative galactinol--sucrose galactosyltransferase [Rosa chinensis]
MLHSTVVSPKALQLNLGFSSFLATNQNQSRRRRSIIFCSQTRDGSARGGVKTSTTSSNGWRQSMFVGTKPALEDSILSVSGKHVLTDVPPNVVFTPIPNSSAAFLGATSQNATSQSRHVFKLGVLRDVRLLSLFRFKLWWMIPRVGSTGSDIPVETQLLLLEAKEEEGKEDSTSYILFLPVLDGEFRSSLQGNTSNELEFCVESGDPAIVASESLKAVFVNCGNHPFDLVNESMKTLAKHYGSFALRETKQMPGMLDCFGWCTWDAFYQGVNPKGIRDGLRSLSEGGTPAKFLIIDDGWQDTSNEFQKEGEPFVEGTQFGGRLNSIEENNKFRSTTNMVDSDKPSGLKDFVSEIKNSFGLRYVYVWHALLGYWGGLVPNAPGTKKYNPKFRHPVQSPGNLSNMRDGAMDSMEKYGVGVIDPAKAYQFYDDLHGYLVSQDVDGVKVDVQNILETVSAGLGGRVSLTRRFQQALEKSIATHFQDNSIICCMGQSTDSIYHSKRSAITRASDDYYPKNPTTQTLHIAAVAFNSIFLGEVFVPDWDMFYSRHEAAEFHAAARAVGGCGVYVSDKPGQHDFEILKRLVLPDGTVLRARYPGRPSRDCLFVDPVMDGKSLLKIWNLNKCNGVIGIFNCQGAGSWPCLEHIVQVKASEELSGKVSPADIEYFEEVSGKLWTGDCAVYSFKQGYLSRLPKDKSVDVTLQILQCDVFTVSPIKVYKQNIQFAPIGLLNMYNSGGAVDSIDLFSDASSCVIHIKGRGAGSFGAYSSSKPKSCSVNSKDEGFEFRGDDNLLTVTIAAATSSWNISFSY